MIEHAQNLFLAELRQGTTPKLEVVVKFTATYNQEAHEIVAGLGRAPAL